jgi:threonine dehydrogenase-like Zn-dependent dehydrogenase
MTMRALVRRGASAILETRPVPVAGPTDAIVRTTAASMCSADIAALVGDIDVPDGRVLGHEAVGTVHALGHDVDGFEIGDRVAVSSGTSCGRCRNCQRGYDGHCGGREWGAYSSGVSRDGSLAEFFTVPDARRNLAPIPDGVEDWAAVCAADSLCTGTSAYEQAALPLGGVVAVFGQGHVGLGATAGGRVSGAGLVVTVKARAGGEDVSRAMGADVCLNLAEHDVVAEIDRLTEGHGVDVAVEASGVRESFPRAVEVTRLGGVISVLSSYNGPPDAELSIPLAHWGWGVGDKTVLSNFARTGNERLGRVLRLVSTGRLDPAPMITHRYRFDEVDQAVADLRARRGVIKPLITF